MVSKVIDFRYILNKKKRECGNFPPPGSAGTPAARPQYVLSISGVFGGFLPPGSGKATRPN